MKTPQFQQASVVHDDLPIQFVGKRKHANGKTMNQYQFVCSSCGASGELGVMPNKTELVSCPEKCGALFIQLAPTSIFGQPRLIEVTASSVTKAITEGN